MAPKAKKPSKAELAAEAERLAEEQRIADGIEVKRQEELRIQRELEAAAEAERRRVLEEEHLARVAAEDETHVPSYATAAAELRKERAAFDADKLWRRYMTESVLPDPADQPNVHSYFYAWEATPASADFDGALDRLRDAAALRAELLADSRLSMEQVPRGLVGISFSFCSGGFVLGWRGFVFVWWGAKGWWKFFVGRVIIFLPVPRAAPGPLTPLFNPQP
jgi:hypothetical protein